MEACEKPSKLLCKPVNQEPSFERAEEEYLHSIRIHPDLLEFKLKNTNCQVLGNNGDWEEPWISSDEEDSPVSEVPVQTSFTEHPSRSFISNLSNNRWLRRQTKPQTKAHRSSDPVQISLVKPKTTPKKKPMKSDVQPNRHVKVVSLSLSKTSKEYEGKKTINLVEHIRSS